MLCAEKGALALRFERAASKGYPFVLESQQGEARGFFRPPALGFAQAWQQATANDLARWGRHLHTALFHDETERLLERTRGAAGDAQALTLSICADQPDSPLWHWPWELLTLCDGTAPLVVTRSVLSSMPKISPQIEPPLRLLLAGANPTGPDRLFLQQEQNLIERVLADHGSSAHLCQDITLKKLRSLLLETGAHVLHLMGHGNDHGLILQDSRGDRVIVNGADLAAAMPRPGPRLVVLSACHSGSARIGAALAAVTGCMVIAMQSRVHDECMPFFFETFYRRLLAGSSVDHAVFEARASLRFDYPESPDWCCPVLYQRQSARLLPESEPLRTTVQKALGQLINGIEGVAPAESRIRVCQGRRDEPGSEANKAKNSRGKDGQRG